MFHVDTVYKREMHDTILNQEIDKYSRETSKIHTLALQFNLKREGLRERQKVSIILKAPEDRGGKT